ncbi:MAG: SRPBCC family protein [Saprospiraceae bacterium]
MVAINQLEVVKDVANKQLRLKRSFNAPREAVWRAWTEPALLEQWWAPKPWKAVSKSMDFREGGSWLYCMTGPEGEAHWAVQNYISIKPIDTYTLVDAFCDEEGNINPDFPSSHITNVFESTDGGTRVSMTVNFEKESDITTMIEMGFEAGFTMALKNLDELLERGI